MIATMTGSIFGYSRENCHWFVLAPNVCDICHRTNRLKLATVPAEALDRLLPDDGSPHFSPPEKVVSRYPQERAKTRLLYTNLCTTIRAKLR